MNVSWYYHNILTPGWLVYCSDRSRPSSFKFLVNFVHNCIPTLFYSLTRNLLTDNLNSSKFFRQNFLLSQICKFPSHEVCKIQKGTVLSFIHLFKSTVHILSLWYLSLHIQMAISSPFHNLTFHILFWQFEIMRRATNPDFTKPENLNHLTFIFFIPENVHFHDYLKWLSLK